MTAYEWFCELIKDKEKFTAWIAANAGCPDSTDLGEDRECPHLYDQVDCTDCWAKFMDMVLKDTEETRKHSMNEITFPITNILPDNGQTITSININGEKIFEINPDCSWEIAEVTTDYTGDSYTPHRLLVVGFRRKRDGS